MSSITIVTEAVVKEQEEVAGQYSLEYSCLLNISQPGRFLGALFMFRDWGYMCVPLGKCDMRGQLSFVLKL